MVGSLSSFFALAAGCQRVLPPKAEPVALMDEQHPMQIDDATARRDFERSTLYYPSSATEAGSTRFVFAPRKQARRVERGFAEPVLFGVNLVVLPFTPFFHAPFKPYDWHAAYTEASYSVQPAYPVEPKPKTAAVTDGGAGAPADNNAPANGAAAPGGPVPEAQSPVPNAEEPVREVTGQPPNLPTENQGQNERPGTPADNTAEPSAPAGDTGGSTGSGTGGGAGAGGGQ